MLPFMNRGEPMSSVDTAWLHMEHPTNLMMVTAVLLFDEPLHTERLKATIQHRLLPFDRFRQKVVASRRPLAGARWEEDPHFDLNSHLHRIALPAPGDQAALQALVSDLMSAPLDFSKPLWQIHVIENYGSGSALLVRLHHCIADGIALAMVLLSMTDMIADAPWPMAAQEDKRPKTQDEKRSFVFRLPSLVFHESMTTVNNPARVVEWAKMGAGSALTLGKMALRSADPRTVFKGELNVAKRAAWSQPISLEDVKAVRKVLGGTVNDVLLTAMTGALRRYLLSRGQQVFKDLTFRAAIPVNLRPMEEMGTLGNRFGLVFLDLPVGIEDTVERLAVLKQRMDALKDSPEAAVAFGVLSAIGLTPLEIQNAVVKIFGAKTTAVITNVPGPRAPLYLAGSPISGLMFWVPQSGRVGLGVSIFSYAGDARLGVATDAGLVPDPETIITAFHQEFDEMLELARQV